MKTRRGIGMIGLLLFAGCSAATWEFRGIAAHRIVVDGSEFAVRVKGDRAEAVRVTAELKPYTQVIFARAAVAMEMASGCIVRAGSLSGDPAVVTARLICR